MAAGAPTASTARVQGADASAIIFQVRAETNMGDSVVLVGSGLLGDWDPQQGVALTTTAEDYPIWKSPPVVFNGTRFEYKYVRKCGDGRMEWEADGENRRTPSELDSSTRPPTAVIDDGDFGCVPSEGFGFPEGASSDFPGHVLQLEPHNGGLRVVVVGDSVAAGYKAWAFDGWASRLGRTLHEKFGHGYVNAAKVGSEPHQVLQGFEKAVVPLSPSIVVIAVGLELQRLAHCPDYEREHICAYVFDTVEALIHATWNAGAFPIVGGFYPNAGFGPEQAKLVRQTAAKMKQLGAPILDWMNLLASTSDDCTWAEGVWSDGAHPNTEGHKRMFASIDTAIFEPGRLQKMLAKKAAASSEEMVCFSDEQGFELRFSTARNEVTVINRTENEYILCPTWAGLRESLEAARRDAPWALRRGLYVASCNDQPAALLSLFFGDSGCIESTGAVPSNSTTILRHVSKRFDGAGAKVLFDDGKLTLVHMDNGAVQVLNQTGCEYSVHPMWNELRLATRALPTGIYEDDSGLSFRAAVISVHGLQSRVKVPPRSAIELRYKGPLSSIKRIAVLPLGDRCSIRMLLHKIEYDGPCYPFDLARTTSLADVADIIATGFSDMWNRDMLCYDGEAGRIYHHKWQGLSFAHEVEDEEHPVVDMGPIAARMAKRYTGRAARFDYACRHADRVVFMRTGCASRGEVTNLLERICARYPGLDPSLLLISDQPSNEFEGLVGVMHEREHFDPDKMYEDLSYWMHCAHRFRFILDRHGITSRTLYWCPSNLKEAEREAAEANVGRETVQATPVLLPPPAPSMASDEDVNRCFSHSNLYRLDQQQQRDEKMQAEKPQKCPDNVLGA